MVHNMHTLFFLYKSKINSRGTSPIFCRLTYKGNRQQFSTGLFIKETTWNSETQRIRGSSLKTRNHNKLIEQIHHKLYCSYLELQAERVELTASDIINRYTGKDRIHCTVLQSFEHHNAKMKALIETDYVRATYDKFVVIQNHVAAFIRDTHGSDDYPLSLVRLNFLADLDFYLKTTKGLNQNTINKVIERVKKVFKIAVGNGWISNDPFLLYAKKKYVKEVVFLSTQELATLEKHKFAQPRLASVRDYFIFSCYTGLGFNEAARLSACHLFDEDGTTWIRMIRQKTQRPIAIPLLPKAFEILIEFGYPNKKGSILPTISNQKVNSYLKEIAEVVWIYR